MSANLVKMTTNFPGILVSQYLAASETTVYLCPSNSSVAVGTATLCNTSGSSRTVYLSAVRAGGVAGAQNRVAIVTLAAGESCVVDELVGLLIGPNDVISGYASAATSVSIVISGAVAS